MTKPKQTKTGWHTQVYLGKDQNGKPHVKSITCQYKWQCIQEAEKLETALKKKSNANKDLTIRQAIENYIAVSEILDVTTLDGYDSIFKYAFQDILDTPLYLTDSEFMQKAINREAKRPCLRKKGTISAKTVKNEWGLLSSALKAAGYEYNVRLPKNQHQNKILPEPSVVLEAIKGDEIELPCLLAMLCSLRLSEVRGIMCDSIKNDLLVIDQVMVQTKKGDVLKSNAKTDSSKRIVKIPPYVLDLINNTDSMINYRKTGENRPIIYIRPSTLRHRFSAKMEQAGYSISFHDLRSIFASIMLTKVKADLTTVQKLGGWKDSNVLLKHYSRSFSEDKEKAFQQENEYFESLLSAGFPQDKSASEK